MIKTLLALLAFPIVASAAPPAPTIANLGEPKCVVSNPVPDWFIGYVANDLFGNEFPVTHGHKAQTPPDPWARFKVFAGHSEYTAAAGSDIMPAVVTYNRNFFGTPQTSVTILVANPQSFDTFIFRNGKTLVARMTGDRIPAVLGAASSYYVQLTTPTTFDSFTMEAATPGGFGFLSYAQFDAVCP